MEHNTEKLVDDILESYRSHELITRLDEENILNKEILIEVTEKIRQLLFPGYFDPNRVRTEYAKFLVGERLEFIQYHLRKQVAKALGKQDDYEYFIQRSQNYKNMYNPQTHRRRDTLNYIVNHSIDGIFFTSERCRERYLHWFPEGPFPARKRSVMYCNWYP